MDHDVEARLIEQEHRLIRVVQNYANRKQWDDSDPRRKAARNALIWRAIAPVSVAAAGGGLIAIGTLIVLIWQTKLIGEQNSFFKEQNSKLQAQIDLQAEQDSARRRTEVIANLYETLGSPSDPSPPPRANARTRRESLFEFIRLERHRLATRKAKGAPLDELNVSQARLDGINLIGVDLSDAILAGTWLQNTDLSRSNLNRADLRAAYMDHTDFARSDLREMNCEGCNFVQATFAHADLRQAILTSAGVRGCEFLGADLRGAEMTALRDYLEAASFKYTNIAGIKASQEFVQWAKRTQGAVEMTDDLEWRTFRAKRFPQEPVAGGVIQ